MQQRFFYLHLFLYHRAIHQNVGSLFSLIFFLASAAVMIKDRSSFEFYSSFSFCSFFFIFGIDTLKTQRDLYGSKAEMVMAEVAAASGGSHQSLQQLNSNRGSKFNLMASGSGSGGSGGPGMKTKWMKAFRTLTNSSSSQNVSASGSTSSTTGSSPPLGNSITPDQ